MVVGVALMYMLVVKTIESIHECDMRYIATDTQLCNKLVHSLLGLHTQFVISGLVMVAQCLAAETSMIEGVRSGTGKVIGCYVTV